MLPSRHFLWPVTLLVCCTLTDARAAAQASPQPEAVPLAEPQPNLPPQTSPVPEPVKQDQEQPATPLGEPPPAVRPSQTNPGTDTGPREPPAAAYIVAVIATLLALALVCLPTRKA